MRFVMTLWLLLFSLTGLAASAIHEYHLTNGLTVIVKEDHRAPVALFSIWYKVGSSDEYNGITGISHVLEHMMFKGTKKYGPGVFNKIISENGGEQNAMTTADFTMYYQKLAADKLPLSFELEADRMRNLSMTEGSFTKELQVVLAEKRMRIEDDPQSLTYVRFNAAAFVSNPYHHPVIGWTSDIENLTLANLEHWYRTWYAPNNAVLVIVGDVQPQKIYALAQQYFGAIPTSLLPAIKPRIEIAAIGRRELNVEAPARLPFLMMGYNVPTLATSPEKWQPYALAVIAGIFSEGNSSRFARDLIRGQQIAVSADANYDFLQKYSSEFFLTGVPNAGFTTLALQQAFLQQIAQLQKTLVSQKELASIKAQLIAENVYKNDSLMAQAMDLGRPMMSHLGWQVSEDFINNIEKITPEQIQKAANLYFIPKNLTIAVLKPEAIVTTAHNLNK